MARKIPPRMVVAVLVVGAVTGAACAFWTLAPSSIKVPPVPTPVMPHPNAYDYYAKAEKLTTDSDAVDFAFSPIASYSKSVTRAQEDAAARANMAVVSMVRKAFKYQYLSPPRQNASTFDENLSKSRWLALVIAYEGRYATAHGRYDDALVYDIDDCRMGTDLARGSNLLGALVDYDIQAIGLHHAWELVDRVSASTAKSQALRLYHITADELTTSQVLQLQEWSGQASLERTVRDRNWRDQYKYEYDPLGTGKPGPSLRDRWNDLMLYTISGPKLISDYYIYMQKEIKLAGLPYSKRILAGPVDPNDRIIEMLDPKFDRFGNQYDKFGWQHDKCIVFDELMATMLALRAYDLEKGHYPATLSQLVPAYLPAVPVDPFADGLPLKYKLYDKSFILYSVGPDGKDDGGTPICDPTLPSSRKYSVREQTQLGDIVAGVNH